MNSQGARLWLVRHGQTDWNAQGRIQGHTPTELNEEGRRQAAELAGIFARSGRQFAACFSSDLPRAAQTADAIAAALGLNVIRTQALRERSFGSYEGQTSEQIRAARTALGLHQTGDLADWTGVPGIESNEVLWKRVEQYLRGISEQHAGTDVLVVTHGGVIARAIFRTLGIAEGAPRRFPLSNGIVAVLQWRVDSFYLLTLADMKLVAGAPPAADTANMRTGKNA